MVSDVMYVRPNDSLFFHCMFGHLKLDQLAFTPCLEWHGGQTKGLDGDEADDSPEPDPQWL